MDLTKLLLKDFLSFVEKDRQERIIKTNELIKNGDIPTSLIESETIMGKIFTRILKYYVEEYLGENK